MLRSALLIFLGVAVTAFMAAMVVILFPLLQYGENSSHRIATLWAKILLVICGVKANVIGSENVPTGGPHIFMANHQSDFDILLALAYIPGQFRWIAKKELFVFPIFGKAMRRAGYIELDRQNRAKALRSLDEAALEVKKGKSLMTFPEGTRSRDGEIGPFKKGLFYLAIRSGVPIIPYSIVGSREIMPRRSLRIRPQRVTIVIDKPIDVTGCTLDERDDLIQEVRGVIAHNFYKYKKDDRDTRKE
jgi:1-acyl-sn-glycerol-3-phosphate acyltransferase